MYVDADGRPWRGVVDGGGITSRAAGDETADSVRGVRLGAPRVAESCVMQPVAERQHRLLVVPLVCSAWGRIAWTEVGVKERYLIDVVGWVLCRR